jgi:uncharacterized protein
MDHITLPGVPFPLNWHHTPASWALQPEGELTITAAEKTDWFINPSGEFAVHNAASLLFNSSGPEMLSAFVTVEYQGLFDAGALVVYQNPTSWAKLCLELSPLNKLMIVSVVTKGISDDCNSFLVEGKSAYLRISRLEQAFAFHTSSDGEYWNLVRHFTLGPVPDLKMGFLAQAPTGPGCRVAFHPIRYAARLLEDIRSGE